MPHFRPPPPRAQHRGGTPLPDGLFSGPPGNRRPAGARVPDAATPVAPIIFFKIFMAKPESPADFGKTAFPSFAGLVRSRYLSKFFFNL